MKKTYKDYPQGFTLVELLVVISIIALLLGILLPSLNKARQLARALKSASNMRQWGLGSVMFTNENNGTLPWEGNKDDKMGENFKSDKWWANGVPIMLGQKSYRQISETAMANNTYVPLPPDSDNIFIDPAAKFPSDKTKDAIMGWDKSTNYEYQLFFCYVFNSELNNGPTISYKDDIENVKIASIKRTSETALMLEMRTTNEELDKNDDEYYLGRHLLGRHRGDWKRIARRHLKGAHIVFCDGHTERVKYDWATTNRQGTRDPDERDGDWNKSGLIWNAFGPSLK